MVDRWATTFSTSDPDELTEIYWPDALLLGTTSPLMSERTEAILKYFSPLKGSGFKSVIGERRTIVLSDNAVMVAGFYELGLQDGKPVTTPARFTMVIVERDGDMANRASSFIATCSTEVSAPAQKVSSCSFASSGQPAMFGTMPALCRICLIRLRKAVKVRSPGRENICGTSQGWKLSRAIKTSERKLSDNLGHGGQRPSGVGGGQCPCTAEGQCHSGNKAGIGFGKDRSANGSVQCDCPNGDEASFVAAKYFLDLDAAGDLRDIRAICRNE